MIEKIIILIGPPGAGKGFYGNWIIKNKGFVKYSTGDIARRYIEMESDLAKEIRVLIKNGKLISPEIISGILFKEINDVDKKIMIDGFPRNLKQEKFFVKELKRRKLRIKPIVLFLDIDEKTSNDRVVGRLTCLICGQSYHVKIKPSKIEGKCDFDNSQLIRRLDENNNEKRWEVYNNETIPLIQKMKESNNYIFIKLDCSKKSNIIFDKLNEIFEN